MSALGKFVKSALVAGVFAAATAAQAASVPIATYNISGSVNYTINTVNPLTDSNPETAYPTSPAGSFFYQLVMGAYDQWVTFTLADTNPDGTPVRYRLWNDTESSLGLVGTSGSPVAYPYSGGNDYIVDVPSSSTIPFFKVLLSQGQQYVLEINKTATNWSQISTDISAVPLPGAIWMFGTALLGFLGFSSRRKV